MELDEGKQVTLLTLNIGSLGLNALLSLLMVVELIVVVLLL